MNEDRGNPRFGVGSESCEPKASLRPASRRVLKCRLCPEADLRTAGEVRYHLEQHLKALDAQLRERAQLRNGVQLDLAVNASLYDRKG